VLDVLLDKDILYIKFILNGLLNRMNINQQVVGPSSTPFVPLSKILDLNLIGEKKVVEKGYLTKGD